MKTVPTQSSPDICKQFPGFIRLTRTSLCLLSILLVFAFCSTHAHAVPGQSAPVSPIGNIISTTPVFSWTKVSDATWYYLYVNDSSGHRYKKWYTSADASCGVSNCSVLPTTALNAGNAVWWVRAWNGSGSGPWSDRADFTIGGANPPAKVTLVSPLGATTGPGPVFSWGPVANASWYQLWADDVTGNRIKKWYRVADIGCEGGNGVCSAASDVALSAGAARWWVRGWNQNGNGAWSSRGDFEVVDAGSGCSVTERAGRVFDVSWSDYDVYKYVVQRSVDNSAWFWRGAILDNIQSSYLFTDDTSPAAPAGSQVDYRLMARSVDDSSPLIELATCESADSGGERYSTQAVNGRWEIVANATGQPVQWRAVNVRSDGFIGASPKLLGAEDLQELATRFNALRLSIHWEDMQPSSQQFNTDLKNKIENVLNLAEQNDIDVILDPVHLGGGDNFWIPDWVWQVNGISQGRENSFTLLQRPQIHEYLDWIMTSGLGTHPAVVAIEVVNEPHPAGSADAWRVERQIDLLVEYKKMVETIRDHRPNVLVLLGSYYGGHLFDNGLGEANPLATVFKDIADPVPNLIWTAHNYFTGIEPDREGPDYDQDGLADIDGQGFRGTRGAGVWTEGYASFGCYAQNPPYTKNPFNCDLTFPLRNQARLGHAANAANHDRVAQDANMPFLMGEFGMGRLWPDNSRGWSGVKEFMCDKLAAYDDIEANNTGKSISWAVWAFDSRIDGGFGLYDSVLNEWQSPTSDAFDGQCP